MFIVDLRTRLDFHRHTVVHEPFPIASRMAGWGNPWEGQLGQYSCWLSLVTKVRSESIGVNNTKSRPVINDVLIERLSIADTRQNRK
jgi:hypothetical protein